MATISLWLSWGSPDEHGSILQMLQFTVGGSPDFHVHSAFVDPFLGALLVLIGTLAEFYTPLGLGAQLPGWVMVTLGGAWYWDGTFGVGLFVCGAAMALVYLSMVLPTYIGIGTFDAPGKVRFRTWIVKPGKDDSSNGKSASRSALRAISIITPDRTQIAVAGIIVLVFFASTTALTFAKTSRIDIWVAVDPSYSTEVRLSISVNGETLYSGILSAEPSSNPDDLIELHVFANVPPGTHRISMDCTNSSMIQLDGIADVAYDLRVLPFTTQVAPLTLGFGWI